MHTKSLALGIFLLLLLSGIVSAINTIHSDTQSIGIALFAGGSEEEKPDLVITDIFEKNDFYYPFSHVCLYVKVLNDGDVSVGGFKIRNISYNPFAGMGISIYSNYCTITGNIISDIDSIGIYLSNSNSNTITGNSIISHNVYGIELYGSNNTITGNIISNNLFGIVLSNSVFNTILKNNFLDNEQDASFITSILNQWKQNYWNEPRILPKLIFGLIIIGSILIPWINFDLNPSSEPYDIGV